VAIAIRLCVKHHGGALVDVNPDDPTRHRDDRDRITPVPFLTTGSPRNIMLFRLLVLFVAITGVLSALRSLGGSVAMGG